MNTTQNLLKLGQVHLDVSPPREIPEEEKYLRERKEK